MALAEQFELLIYLGAGYRRLVQSPNYKAEWFLGAKVFKDGSIWIPR